MAVMRTVKVREMMRLKPRHKKNCFFRFCQGALFFLAAFPLSAHAASCKVGDPFPFKSKEKIEECPPPIQGWMDRANGCAHLQGEMGGADSSASAEMEEEWAELQCDFIGCDFDQVYGRYEGDIIYIGILTAYADYVYGDAGVPKCPIPPEGVSGEGASEPPAQLGAE